MDEVIAQDVQRFIDKDITLYRVACRHSLSEMLGHPVSRIRKKYLREAVSRLCIAEKSLTCTNETHSAESIVNSNPVACWLSSQKISAGQLKLVLSVAEAPEEISVDTNVFLELSADEAWQLSARALSNSFPGLKAVVDEIAAQTPKLLVVSSEKYSLPFTHDMGWGELPFISINCRGMPGDIVCIAHEMAHALQIVASQRSNHFYTYDMPAIGRESCAFIGELALLDYLREKDEQLSVLCCSAWIKDSKRFLGSDRDDILTALDKKSEAFSYRWNYPLARILAAYLWEQDKALTQDLFSMGSKMNLVTLCEMVMLEKGHRK